MVRIPNYEAKQGLEVGSAPRLPDVDQTGARALQNVGNAVADLGATMAEADASASLAKAKSEFGILAQRAEITGQNSATGEAGGFSQTLQASLSTQRGKILQSMPHAARARFTSWSEGVISEATQRGLVFEDQSRKATRLGALDQAVTNNLSILATDPSQYGVIKARLDVDREASRAWLSPAEEQRVWGRVPRDMNLARLMALPPKVRLEQIQGLKPGGTATTNRVWSALLQAENASGNPAAVSSKGALGLAQVMPDTAREMAQKLGRTDIAALSDDQLQQHFAQNPRDNLLIGHEYLSSMIERYSGDHEAAIIAYNAGPARADAWIKAGRNDSSLPSETVEYRNRIEKTLGTDGSGPGVRSQIASSSADMGRLSAPAKAMLDGIARAGVVPEIRVRSGFRDAQRNAAADGADGSQHIHGNAVDIDISGMDEPQKAAFLQAAIASGARGIGIYPSGNSLHIDTRDVPTVWGGVPGDSFKGHSVSQAPGWARPALSALMRGEVPQQTSAWSGGGRQMDEALSGLTPDDIMKIETDARRQIRGQDDGVKQMVRDDIASMRSTGQGAPNLTEDMVSQTLGDDAVDDWRRQRGMAETYYQAVGDLASASDEEITKRIDDLAPQPGTPFYSERATLQANVEKEAVRVRKQRSEDPAASVESVPAVRAALAGARLDSPQSIQAAAKVTLDAQAAVGIPEYARRVLTNDQARELARPIVSAGQLTGRDDVSRNEKQTLTEVVTQIERIYGPEYAEGVLAQVIERTSKDRQMGPLAASILRKVTAGITPSASDRQNLEIASDAANAAQAVQGTTATVDSGTWVLPEARLPPRGTYEKVEQPSFPTPPPQAWRALIADPGLAEQYDRKYGPGAAKAMLGSNGVDGMKTSIPAAQQSALSAALKAIASPNVDRKAIAQTLRDANINESLWPAELQQ